MAKKTTKTTKEPEVPSTPAEKPTGRDIGAVSRERAARRKHIAQQDVFHFVKDSEKPLAPQAGKIVEVVKGSPEGIGRAALLEALKPVLITRQPVERILAYYQSTLVEGGLIRIENPERPADEVPANNGEPANTGGTD